MRNTQLACFVVVLATETLVLCNTINSFCDIEQDELVFTKSHT